MPLTAAEKMRRYRQRIKEDPERYKKYTDENKKRLKTSRKRIAELSEEEKPKIREKWRIQKQKNRQERKNNKKDKETSKIINDESVTDTKNNQHIAKYWRKKFVYCNKKIETLQKVAETLKKRLYRQRHTTAKKIQLLEKTIENMKAREEILESSLKQLYKNSNRLKRKKLRTSVKETKNIHLQKAFGIQQRQEKKKKERSTAGDAIVKFYLRDDVSRCTAGKKECRTKKKQKMQIRYLLGTIVNMYQKYRLEGGKAKFTTFYNYKPFYVLSPNLRSRNTCLCIKHSNIDYKFSALKKIGAIDENIKSVKDVLTSVCCDIRSHICVNSKCPNCKHRVFKFNLTDSLLNANISYDQWERADHTYKKKDADSETATTKKTVLANKFCTVSESIAMFLKDIEKFKVHYFNYYHQQQKYQSCVENLKDNEAVVLCDFSQNYETKLREEVQSMYYGASKGQITLHTGMIYFKHNSQSFCTVSPNNMHQPPAIWAHLSPVLSLIKKKSLISVVHFFSDGPTSQYRQKNNFYLLDVFTRQLGFEYCTWSYFESGHGKGVADGIGGSVKRALDKQVSFGKDVANAKDAYDLLRQCMKVVKIWYIDDASINSVATIIPSVVPTLIGTMRLHQIITTGNGIVSFRDVSCFCGELRGRCDCFELKYHEINTDKALINNKDLEPSSATQLLKSSVTDISVDTLEIMDIDMLPKDSEPIPAIQILKSNEAMIDAMEIINLDILSKDTETSSAIEILTTNETDTSVDATEKNNKDIISKDSEPSSAIQILNFNETEISIDAMETIDILSDDDYVVSSNSAYHDSNLISISLGPSIGSVIKIPGVTDSNHTGKSTKTLSVLKHENNKKIKSIRTTVKRRFLCDLCRGPLVVDRIAKCMCCSKWLCVDCSGGQTYFDYICNVCLGE